MQPRPKILFLYAHIQPFLLSGIHKLIMNYNAEVLVVCWPVPEASPTNFTDSNDLTFIVKDEKNLPGIRSRVLTFDADIIYVVGWMDKDYLQWAREYRKRGKKTLMAMDTQWKGSIRQRLHCLLSPFTLKRIYDYAWIPGYFQYEYARRLGFSRDRILNNLLIPDVDSFKDSYERNAVHKKESYPNTFLYIGRLVSYKFETLLSAFTSLSDDEQKGWKLIVVGNGPLATDLRMQNRNIMYKGFLQQAGLIEVLKGAGVFCLTATDEPWGTVIQEAAAAGLPLLLSKQCGARYSLLIPGYNGWLCDGNNTKEIREKLKGIIALQPKELFEMGKRSNEIGSTTNSDIWAATLMSVYQKS